MNEKLAVITRDGEKELTVFIGPARRRWVVWGGGIFFTIQFISFISICYFKIPRIHDEGFDYFTIDGVSKFFTFIATLYFFRRFLFEMTNHEYLHIGASTLTFLQSSWLYSTKHHVIDLDAIQDVKRDFAPWEILIITLKNGKKITFASALKDDERKAIQKQIMARLKEPREAAGEVAT